MYPLRVRSSTDGTLLVASRQGTAPILVTRVAQDGTVLGARGYDVSLDTCNVDPKALASDGAGGAWVAGGCIGRDRSFLLHAGATRTAFWVLDFPFFRIRVLEAIGDDVFVSGDGTADFALIGVRIRPDGTIVYAKRYLACPAARDGIPSAALVGAQGEITIAGSGGAQHNGALVRILPDGNLGFATFRGFSFGAGSVFLLDSLAELPTTGFVAGGTHVRFTAQEPDNVSSTALLGFDAGGRLQWARRYAFGGPGDYRASGQVAVRLSDDGGGVTTALVDDPLDPLGGFLWSFKPFAKNGHIDFLPGAATALPLDVVELDCPMTASDVPLALTPVAVPARSVSVASAPMTLAVAQQTAQ